MTRTGDREIGVVSGRLPDNTGELACMGSPYLLGVLICGLVPLRVLKPKLPAARVDMLY